MKKILILLSLTLCLMVSCNDTKAQSSTGAILMYKTTGNLSAIASPLQKSDTLTNAGTTYAINNKTLLGSLTGNYDFTFTATNISGTSTFKVVLFGSPNGVDWYPATGNPGTDGFNCDTLQCTSVTTAKRFQMTLRPGAGKSIPAYSTTLPYFNTRNRWAYLRASYIGTGTQSTKLTDPQINISN